MAEKVSIHTPTKGVTLADEEGRILPYCFNPHTHEGCDTTFVEHSSDYFSFNPHTHEGCDAVSICSKFHLCSFNPHTHEGCDSELKQQHYQQFQFQSTHPRRV